MLDCASNEVPRPKLRFYKSTPVPYLLRMMALYETMYNHRTGSIHDLYTRSCTSKSCGLVLYTQGPVPAEKRWTGSIHKVLYQQKGGGLDLYTRSCTSKSGGLVLYTRSSTSGKAVDWIYTQGPVPAEKRWTGFIHKVLYQQQPWTGSINKVLYQWWS